MMYWSGRQDSNLRPHAPHACTLPGCATPRRGRDYIPLTAQDASCKLTIFFIWTALLLACVGLTIRRFGHLVREQQS